MIGQQNFQNGVYQDSNPYRYTSNYGFSPSNPQPQQSNPAIQYSSVVVVRNEDEAKMYPVGPGVSVTFKNENEPYIYTKTMGFNQLEPPVFKRYLLVEEIQKEKSSEIQELRDQISELREMILKNTKSQPVKKTTKEDLTND